MSDELRTWFRRTADDSDRPLPARPAELLARAQRDWKRHRIWTAGVTGGLAVGAAAAVIAATAVIPSGDGGSNRGVQPVDRSDSVEPTDSTVPVDRGSLNPEQKQAIMTICGAWAAGELGGDGYQVALARVYDRMDGPAGLVVLQMDNGRIMDCTASLDSLIGGEATEGIENPHPSSLPTDIPEPDAQHPLVSFRPFFSKGHRSLSDPKGTYFEASGVFLAAGTVGRVEVRVGTPDGPEPWRVAEVRNGLVFWTAWAEPGTLNNDDDVWVTWRAYDKQGNLIDPDLMPYPPQRVKPVIR